MTGDTLMKLIAVNH